MKTRAELKQEAKDALSGKWWLAVKLTLIYVGSYFLASFISAFFNENVQGIITLIINIALIPLAVGFIRCFMNISRGEETVSNDLFWGYKNCLQNSIFTNVLVGLFTFLWSLLFIVPGIIKGLSYSMSLFLLADNPDMSPTDAIRESMKMMEGHKWELFVLELSFIGWGILATFILGIGYVWLIPYMQTTLANFYFSLKNAEPVIKNTIQDNPIREE